MSVLTDDVIANLKSAASLLTGFKRRQFQAEMALKYCDGSARRAERVFGWGRDAVHTGLNELRTGIRCIDAANRRGRKKTEDRCPALAEHIHRLVEPTAQADPKFQTIFAYTRITAEAVRNALKTQDDVQNDVPCRQTVGRILHRLGYRLRRVLKARPEKKSRKPTPSSPTSRRRASRRRQTRTLSESPSIPRRK